MTISTERLTWCRRTLYPTASLWPACAERGGQISVCHLPSGCSRLAPVLRTETELVLKSRRVIPGRLLQEGFSFTYPDWPEAARELSERWKAERHRGVR
ncbi:MAG: DUF1731 domain-containing protein [Terriglobales bacterium]